ncbi:TMEM175 family protein [Streptomyces sp. NPDC058691]|uniref:TMEM175 family protein n=1 Tax=Streptomyces sp. NPDC058691 TaxID=3346601 RepID=UPI003655A76E
MAVAKDSGPGESLAVREHEDGTVGEETHPTPAAERMLLFTDAVVAIAITLLALELPLPQGHTNSELWHSATEDRRDYQAFLISFAVVWAHWSSHRRMFRAVRRLDGVLSGINGLWLLMVVLIPFAMKVLAPDGAFQARFGFFAVIQTLAALLFGLMAWHIPRAGLAGAGAPPGIFSDALERSIAIAACFAVSVPVSLTGDWAYLCWGAAPIATRLVSRSRSRSRSRA